MDQKPEKARPDGANAQAVEGVLERFTFRDQGSGFAVVQLVADAPHGRMTAVGQLAQLAEGQRLKLSGTIIDHPRYGPQLRVEEVEAVLPASVVGIRAYLSSSLVKGIGPAIAERITERFGVDALRIIAEEPDRLAEVPGLGRRRIEELSAAVAAQRDVQDLMVFLRAHGLGQALATRVVKRYGKGAAALVQGNPYRLADDVIGVGFRTADRLAGELGMAPDAPDRIQAGALFCLSRAARDGHCFLPFDELMTGASALLDLPIVDLPAASDFQTQIEELARQGRVVTEIGADAPKAAGAGETGGEERRVYPKTLILAERGVAQQIGLLRRTPAPPLRIDPLAALAWFEERSGVKLPEGQRAAVRNALTHPISVITGGPGVGKTTIVHAIAAILAHHDLHLQLAAPTGRAAKRLEESTRRSASTIHRLLDWQAGIDRFGRDADHPLEGHMLVVDEASMLDIQLAYHLFRAIPPTLKLVLVGDVDQLPPVGPGQVLNDIIASAVVPVTRLVDIFRQKGESLIVRNAHGLLAGELPASGDENSDFFFIEARDNPHARSLILELVSHRIPRRFGMDPLDDIQVLCPMYRGHAGADAVNKDLQAALNPDGAELHRGDRTFREGDKVMQIRNDYDLDLYNGDTGRILRVDSARGHAVVRFGTREVEYGPAELESLLPAYAITVHRAQGSEYPAVVLPLATDHFMMLRRNLLYTAITRAKKLVVLVGSARALRMAVDNDSEARRHSGLASRLLK